MYKITLMIYYLYSSTQKVCANQEHIFKNQRLVGNKKPVKNENQVDIGTLDFFSNGNQKDPTDQQILGGINKKLSKFDSRISNPFFEKLMKVFRHKNYHLIFMELTNQEKIKLFNYLLEDFVNHHAQKEFQKESLKKVLLSCFFIPFFSVGMAYNGGSYSLQILITFFLITFIMTGSFVYFKKQHKKNALIDNLLLVLNSRKKIIYFLMQQKSIKSYPLEMLLSFQNLDTPESLDRNRYIYNENLNYAVDQQMKKNPQIWNIFNPDNQNDDVIWQQYSNMVDNLLDKHEDQTTTQNCLNKIFWPIQQLEELPLEAPQFKEQQFQDQQLEELPLEELQLGAQQLFCNTDCNKDTLQIIAEKIKEQCSLRQQESKELDKNRVALENNNFPIIVDETNTMFQPSNNIENNGNQLIQEKEEFKEKENDYNHN